jgi:hypothetical protein
MAQVIKFPTKSQGFDGLEWLGDDTRQQSIAALRFVLDSLIAGTVQPTEMLIMYGDHNKNETVWAYLNLGFSQDRLTEAMCRVLDDVEERADRDRE